MTTYDGGILTRDATTLDVIDDTKLEGFNRLNPVGDGDHTHSVAADPQLTDTEEPHHGVAAKLADGSMLRTVGTEDERSGAQVVDDSGKEIASSDDCPGVHGEAAAKDEVIALGCEDGILLYKDGKFEKIDAPNSFGRIGNQSGSDESQYILGDCKVDEDAELERRERVSVTDTKTRKLSLVDLGASYSFRSLGRGPDGEGVVLTTDGTLKIIDPATASVTENYPVIDEWEEPVEWQQARPTLFVQGEVAYVSDPAEKTIHIVDLESGEVMAEKSLPHAPNELTGVTV